MNCKALIIFFIFISVILKTHAVEELNVVVVVVKDVYNDYKVFIDKKNPLTLTDFSGKGSRRDVVELVLLQQALNQNKKKYNIVFKEAPNYKRVIEYIKQGSATMGSNTVWKSDVEEKYVYATVPTIKEGEFEAGFYVSPINVKAMSVKSVRDIRHLVGISSDSWTPDWTALTNLKLKALYSTSTWESMVKMVHAGRGDFLLAPFQSTEDMSLFANGIRLVPINNFKIRLSGSRVFVVSKQSKNSDTIIKDLNDGLIILRDKKMIQKAYSECGFINNKVSNWIYVN